MWQGGIDNTDKDWWGLFCVHTLNKRMIQPIKLFLWKIYVVFERISSMRHRMQYLLCIMVVMYFISITAGQFDMTIFLPTLKPMHCHDTQIVRVRSVVDCALKCQFNFYSCLGYTVIKHNFLRYQCQVCFIYDVRKPMEIVPTPSNNVTNFMPVFNKQDGESTDQTFNLILLEYIDATWCTGYDL